MSRLLRWYRWSSRCAFGFHAFQFTQGKRILLLNIAVALVSEELEIERVGAFPRGFVRLTAESLDILRAARKRKHGHRLAHPNARGFQRRLPLRDQRRIILGGLDEIGLHPGNMLPRA